ncbi:HNH endonuclease signature motif containing protein [Clostridium estertheticum]|uniref:HNH endonuclease signature motif containing protein n=1 Tax=Clostridium estertheticum TaxID=238834 RepID=UPI001C6DF8AA|nr:HNH endonuclease signature motif containing protein [Clostridium estertheticum]MBW9154259.1 HNH endonuclease [Clostridium estertheticum]WLC86686.1 HNH endonuclease [Clostridium estertheticum]
MKHVYTKAESTFIRKNIKGTGTGELTEMFNTYFGLEIKVSSIRTFVKNHGLKSGLNTSFKKGHVSFNKGMKGLWFKGSEKTWFKKGTIPPNHREVGSERITVDGYVEVKITEPNKWRLKQQIVWEKHNGKIAKGYAVIFGDGNRQNSDINNLILVNRQQLLIMNKNKLIQNNAKLTRTGVMIADLYQAISERNKNSTKYGG